MAAYQGALEKTVTEGSVVVDIGTGTGIFALLACKLGARKVYAIEPNDWITVARKIGRENGFEGRIEFIQQFSTQVTLPERADVIISDLRGALPFYDGNIPAMIDARKRFLKENGLLIPQRDVVWAGLVSARKAYAEITMPWKTRRYPINMVPALYSALNQPHGAHFRPAQVLAETVPWVQIDYTSVQNPNAQGKVEFAIAKKRVAHGVGLWFDSEVWGELGFSTSPWGQRTVYGHFFLPFERPLRLEPEDRVVLSLAANLVGKEYIWRWSTALYKGSTSHAPAVEFEQSSFHGEPILPEKVRKKSDLWVPTLNREGSVARAILELMGHSKSLLEISQAIHEAYPGIFLTQAEALERVKVLSEKYSE
jgi:protein arginine N-methyltransferase 1